jgi:hypothetical protein
VRPELSDLINISVSDHLTSADQLRQRAVGLLRVAQDLLTMQLLEGDKADAVGALTFAYGEELECLEDQLSAAKGLGATADIDHLELAHDIAQGTLAQLPGDPDTAPLSDTERLGNAIVFLLDAIKTDKVSYCECCGVLD